MINYRPMICAKRRQAMMSSNNQRVVKTGSKNQELAENVNDCPNCRLHPSSAGCIGHWLLEFGPLVGQITEQSWVVLKTCCDPT